MIQTLAPSSTRHKLKANDKHINSARFFKKGAMDENQRNIANFPDKETQFKANIFIKKISQTKRKKSQNNITAASGKTLKTLGSINGSTKNIETSEKEKSYKNLKLTGSIEFPKILVKSISQTTMNKKLEDKNLKILQKISKLERKYSKNKKGQPQTDQKNQLKINRFQLGKKLGNGRFGSVYLAQQINTKTLFAIKVLNKTKIKQAKMEQQILSEIKLQLYMNHPNILKLYGFFDDAKNIYLILEYCSQCLFKDFRIKGKFNEEQTAYYSKQATSALKYMHNEYIMHRDIKPENILVEHGVLKLSDFGWSIYSPLYKRQTFCGTVDYVPPEIVEGNAYDERVDIWALGVLLYELNSGKAPFQTKNEKGTYQRIVHSQCKFPTHFSGQLTKLVKWILDKNPKKRPNLDEIEQSQWFQQYKTTGRYISKPIWIAWNNL